ncbi:MAG: helix-turn-helix domain-containing protein [bacterium]
MNMVEYRSEFISELRDRMDCNQEEFARIVGVTPTSLSRWENGRTRPKNRTWERLHDLDSIVRSTEDPDRLKRKLLMASSLIDEESPMDLLVEGELEERLQSSFDDDQFLEEIHLEAGLKWDDLLQRKLDYWLELVQRGEIPLENTEAWEELIQYVVPVAKLVKFITGVGIMPNKSRARFARKVFWIDFNRSIKREPLRKLISYGTRVEGYALVLVELVLAFEAYQEDAEELDDRDPEEQWEALEEWWDRVSGWEGDERLEKLLPRIKELCRTVLADVELKYAYKVKEELFSDPGEE